MGNRWKLSPLELEKYRSKILELKQKSNGASKYMYLMLLVWVYEYLEVYSVNGTNQNAGLQPVKNKFPAKCDAIKKLFNIRCTIVHRAFEVSDKILTDVQVISSDINEILLQCGFTEDII